MAFVFKPVVTRKRPDGRRVKRRIKFYWASYTDPLDAQDKRESLRLPSGERVTKREVAEAELRRLLEKRGRLAAGLTNRYVEAAATPVRKLLADYVRHLRRKVVRGKRVSGGHIAFTMHVIKSYMATASVTRIGELTEDRIDSVLGGLTQAGKSARTVNAYRARLHALCEFGVRIAKVVERNPVVLIETRDAEPVRVRRALTPDEARRLLSVSKPRQMWYETALLTGLRVGEIRKLEWRDLILEGGRPAQPSEPLRRKTPPAGSAIVDMDTPNREML